jgi:hypothetical protein
MKLLPKTVAGRWLTGMAIGILLTGALWWTTSERTPQPEHQAQVTTLVDGVHATAPLPEVELVVRSGAGEIMGRTPSRETITVVSPVSLIIQTSTPPDKVEFYAVYGDAVHNSAFGPGPGVIGGATGGEPWLWSIQPGQQVHIYGVAWYGKVGYRSDSLFVRYPMPDENQCPDVSFPPLRPIPHAQVSLIVSADMNLIEIVTPFENLYFSMNVDPKTCKDDTIRHWLEQAPTGR